MFESISQAALEAASVEAGAACAAAPNIVIVAAPARATAARRRVMLRDFVIREPFEECRGRTEDPRSAPRSRPSKGWTSSAQPVAERLRRLALAAGRANALGESAVRGDDPHAGRRPSGDLVVRDRREDDL